jgi:type III secretion protein K
MAEAPVANDAAADMALRLSRLLARFNLHPEEDLHPSWLPADWRARHRLAALRSEAGRAVLSDWLRASGRVPAGFDTAFDAEHKRLALLDARSLRLLAAYCGLGVHLPLWRQRGIGAELRRLARRLGPDAPAYVQQRMPQLQAFAMNPQPLLQRPRGAGRVVMRRGARLLLGLLQAEDAPAAERARLKLPRRLAQGELPQLSAAQRAELGELIHLSVLPERFPQWHWLF